MPRRGFGTTVGVAVGVAVMVGVALMTGVALTVGATVTTGAAAGAIERWTGAGRPSALRTSPAGSASVTALSPVVTAVPTGGTMIEMGSKLLGARLVPRPARGRTRRSRGADCALPPIWSTP